MEERERAGEETSWLRGQEKVNGKMTLTKRAVVRTMCPGVVKQING